MPDDLLLRCRCGRVRGVAFGLSPAMANRVVCYCDDCQAFARFLERADVLDPWGGSDIFQIPQSRLRLLEGLAEVRCMRLSPKGLFRWYAGCCHTPIGNTIGPRLPLVGMLRAFVDPAIPTPVVDRVLGDPVGWIFGRFAIGTPPAHVDAKVPPALMLRTARVIARFWLGGGATPSPFFDSGTGAPRVAPRVLSKEERDALRRAA